MSLAYLCSFLCLQYCSDPSAPISRNPFVETTLLYALSYISSVTKSTTIKPCTITILADNDYYSQSSTAEPSTTTATSAFASFPTRIQDTNKTGLGSSAALVTALTGALLTHYLPTTFTLSSSEPSTTPETHSHPASFSTSKTRLHNLSQAAHCSAQGKIGSGFDIAAAVYGTCIYRRFSPTILTPLAEPNAASFSPLLRDIVDDDVSDDAASKIWDCTIAQGASAVGLPRGTRLIMCDVDCGSSTPGMVRQVLEWRKTDPRGARILWDSLQDENTQLAENLLGGTHHDIAANFAEIRKLIREMSARSGVPIEPEEQTKLLDETIHGVDGVYGGVVPGAGGYDAIVLLVRDDEDVLAEVGRFVADWGKRNGSNVRLLGVRGEMEGVRIEEDPKLYGSWVK